MASVWYGMVSMVRKLYGMASVWCGNCMVWYLWYGSCMVWHLYGVGTVWFGIYMVWELYGMASVRYRAICNNNEELCHSLLKYSFLQNRIVPLRENITSSWKLRI